MNMMGQIFKLTILLLFICLTFSLFLGRGKKFFVKRLVKLYLIYIFGLIAVSMIRNYRSLVDDTTPEFAWNAELFKNESQVYEKSLALAAAEMSEKAEDETGDEIKKLYDQHGINQIKLYYDGADDFFGGSAFAIGQDTLSINGQDTLVLVITARGTITGGEAVGDVFKGWKWNKQHVFENRNVWDNVYDFEEEIWNGLMDYVEKYPNVIESENIKIMITGHSLGGAAACMVGARFNNGIGGNEWWSDKLRVEDIYVYTFGAIKVLTTDENESVGYENIHNLYNYYDSYGPNSLNEILIKGNVSLPGAKFGHTDIFYPDPVPEEEKLTSCVNHWMSTYIKAINEDLVNCEQEYGHVPETIIDSSVGDY